MYDYPVILDYMWWLRSLKNFFEEQKQRKRAYFLAHFLLIFYGFSYKFFAVVWKTTCVSWLFIFRKPYIWGVNLPARLYIVPHYLLLNYIIIARFCFSCRNRDTFSLGVNERKSICRRLMLILSIQMLPATGLIRSGSFENGFCYV